MTITQQVTRKQLISSPPTGRLYLRLNLRAELGRPVRYVK